MLIKNEKTGTLLIPQHKVDLYINSKLQEFGWTVQKLADQSSISKGEISKLKNGLRDSLSAKAFFQLYSAFGDSCTAAAKQIYPGLDLSLNKFSDKKRNAFGKYMNTFETIKNSIDIISVRTGIPLQRLKDLYYRTSAPEAYELLLIEKAIDKKPGEAFGELYRKDIKN